MPKLNKDLLTIIAPSEFMLHKRYDEHLIGGSLKYKT